MGLLKMNKENNPVLEFEAMINKGKIEAYKKQSLKKPLSKSGLEDFKESVCAYYGYSKEDLNKALNGGNK